MDGTDEQRIRARAYELWEKEGSPEGRDQEFWERAQLMIEAEADPPIPTPLSGRSKAENATDQAIAETFPASDPPAFTADRGPGTGSRRR